MNTGEPQGVFGNRMNQRVDLRESASLVVVDHQETPQGRLGCVHLNMSFEGGEADVVWKQIDCLVEVAVLE